ncbi:MAG: hypothetical protein U0531_08580 [Dehalococcoidia bacterium]
MNVVLPDLQIVTTCTANVLTGGVIQCDLLVSNISGAPANNVIVRRLAGRRPLPWRCSTRAA